MSEQAPLLPQELPGVDPDAANDAVAMAFENNELMDTGPVKGPNPETGISAESIRAANDRRIGEIVGREAVQMEPVPLSQREPMLSIGVAPLDSAHTARRLWVVDHSGEEVPYGSMRRPLSGESHPNTGLKVGYRRR